MIWELVDEKEKQNGNHQENAGCREDERRVKKKRRSYPMSNPKNFAKSQ